jgi:hypothetical protein
MNLPDFGPSYAVNSQNKPINEDPTKAVNSECVSELGNGANKSTAKPASGAMLTKATRDDFLLFGLSKKASVLVDSDDCEDPHV